VTGNRSQKAARWSYGWGRGFLSPAFPEERRRRSKRKNGADLENGRKIIKRRETGPNIKKHVTREKLSQVTVGSGKEHRRSSQWTGKEAFENKSKGKKGKSWTGLFKENTKVVHGGIGWMSELWGVKKYSRLVGKST
jgi:hypothetical protein